MNTLTTTDLLLPYLLNRFGADTASWRVPSTPAVQRARPRVLVIGHESALCELLSLCLGRKGLEVATVRPAEGASTLVERGQFDLVVLDWKPDRVEGTILLRLSKARHPEIPVIIVTGTDLSEGSLGSQIAREADAIIRKGPLDALTTAVCQHLDRRRAQACHAA